MSLGTRLIGIDDLKVAGWQLRPQVAVAERSEKASQASKAGAEQWAVASESAPNTAAYGTNRNKLRFITPPLLMPAARLSARTYPVQGTIARQPVAAFANAANSRLPQAGSSGWAVCRVQQWLAARAWAQTAVFVVFDEENQRLREQELAG